MNKYLRYFLYVVEHKKNVFIECLKDGQLIHSLTHDLSKFLPSEFIPYAKFFEKTNRQIPYKMVDENNADFQRGWCFHQKRNKHHWNYWVSVIRKNEIIPIPMPRKYVRQMIVDWKGMSRKFGDTPTAYFLKNKDNMILHKNTVEIIKNILKID
jgi:hypothetical protein